MDSLTQAVLGAAVAHICWHRQLGRVSLVWGALLGTLPDLDVILYPFIDGVERLYWHRGASHSIWFVLVGSVLAGLALTKIRRGNRVTGSRAVAGASLVFATHILIDYFTIYGTQLLAPVSRYGFARGNMFIIDPLFTIPLVAGIVVAGLVKGKTGWKGNAVGLTLSSLYAIFSILSHSYADQVFKNQLAARNVTVLNSLTGATPFNTLLWRHVARTPDGILIGYFSIVGDKPDAPVRFDFLPQNADLLEDYNGQRNVKAIKWFSKGFWLASKKENAVTISDLRFGEYRLRKHDPPDKWQFVFAWKISEDPKRLIRQSPSIKNGTEALAILWSRLKGAETFETASLTTGGLCQNFPVSKINHFNEKGIMYE